MSARLSDDNVFRFSPCSIRSFKSYLLNKRGLLKNEVQCLSSESNRDDARDIDDRKQILDEEEIKVLKEEMKVLYENRKILLDEKKIIDDKLFSIDKKIKEVERKLQRNQN
jgi:hypothetical protein